MKLGALFSGGKDSTFALAKAMERERVVCLISIISENPESYMFHTPNISLVKMQAEALGLPLVQAGTKGEKEKELKDLEAAISRARKEFGIEGIVTGAIESIYQAERVQRVCDRLGLWCFNPLWKKDQASLLQEVINTGFEVIVSGVFAYPLGKSWLGRKIDNRAISELISLQKKYQISPSGEGGEIETTVLDAPVFRRRILIEQSEIRYRENSGIFVIKKAKLVNK
jgi:diphthine-ammonia ligase